MANSGLLMNVPFLVMAQMAARLERRFSPRTIITSGCVLAGIGVAVLAGLDDSTPFMITAIGYAAAGAGCGILVPAITHVAMREAPANAAGTGSALLNCSRQLGTATGLAIIGALGSIATTSRWERTTSGRSSEAVFVTDVVSGRLDVLARKLGADSREFAVAAFLHGYHVALAACVLCLMIAAWISFVAFRPKDSTTA